MSTADCIGYLATQPPVPTPAAGSEPSALTDLIAAELWPLADWKGDRAQCRRAAQAVARFVVSLNSTSAALTQLMDEETRRLADELAAARATIDHMRRAMSWLSGHDRQGLDHLAEANYEARAREAVVAQARGWATRARTAEAALQRLTDWCDALDATAFHVAGRTEPIRVHPVAANIRHHIAGPTAEQEAPK
ncbi:hypothetical protein [Streptomyces sp. KAU_LT]|uniref:hypothetical protein n=1 Tax=Streptomyces sp. KAU_LT TaxID=3046669 RepID=UPI0024B6CF03|nr:hypothetical protein [Streptomyces sp. KAU_LT]MDI9836233.1 hypothetical protein [Streptomyces sp. KAU_LT]